MHTVLPAMRRWLPFFKHHRLAVFTDNTTVFYGLRRRSVWDPAIGPLPKIALLAALHDNIHTRWIPTHENTLADLLSRRDLASLLTFFPS